MVGRRAAGRRRTGKHVSPESSGNKKRNYKKVLPLLMVLLSMAIIPLSIMGPSPVKNEPQVTDETKTFKVPPVRSIATSAAKADEHVTTAITQADNLLSTIPMWAYVGPSKQSPEDFDFLLSNDKHIQLSSLFGLGVKTVVIDPGHGGRDPGAIGAGGTMEKDITLDVSLRLKERLDHLAQFNVLLTRDKDKTLSLAKRVAFAKKNNADLFISVHVNALLDTTMNIIETYYFGAPRNPETLRLAELENKESHFSVGELDLILADLGNTLKRQESAKLATSIQASLFKNIKRQDAQVLNIGIKMAPFVVLSQIEVPSVLVEISCITKKKEEVKLASTSYRSKVAGYIEEGIIAYLETQNLITLDRRTDHE